MVIMKSFTYREPYTKRPEQRFYLSHVGIYEEVQPEIVNRPDGTRDWLFMFFHSPVTIEVDGWTDQYPADTMMIWDETASHMYGNLEIPWSHSWIHCQGAVLPDLLEEAGLDTGVYPRLELCPILEKYLPLIHQERVRGDMDPMILEQLFTCLLREIGRQHAPRSHALPPRIHALKHYLDTHYRERLVLDDLCERAAMSKPHLISEFRKHMGMPPVSYLICVRLGHARSLLLNRNLSVGELAERVGYADIYHFSKLFKKHMGKSPSAFRGHP